MSAKNRLPSIVSTGFGDKLPICGGEGGIRTPGTRERTIDFESTALDHSATSPKQMGTFKNGLQRYEKILQRPKMLIWSCNP